MPTVYLDKPENLNLIEDRGAIRGLTTQALVEFTPAELTAASARNHKVLRFALDQLDARNLYPLSTLAQLTDDDAHNLLVLVRRKPTVRPQDHHFVDVMLEYEHVHDGFNQILLKPPSGVLFVKGRSSVVDKATNFYYPFGIKANGRRQITVAHTFGLDQMGQVNMGFMKNRPRTVEQGGEINIPFPQHNFTVQGLVFTKDMDQFVKNTVGHVATDVILDQPSLHYLCTEVAWELNTFTAGLNIGGKTRDLYSYRVSMEFQFNHDTWDPTVVFHDQRTGRAPAGVSRAILFDSNNVLREVMHPEVNLRQPAGYWEVPALPRQNFQGFLNARFERLGA